MREDDPLIPALKSTWAEHTPLSEEMKSVLTDELGGDWELAGDDEYGMIRKSYTFEDFAAGVEFVNIVAALAKEQDHYPEVWIGGDGEVKLILNTPAIHNLTMADFFLAGEIDRTPRDGETFNMDSEKLFEKRFGKSERVRP